MWLPANENTLASSGVLSSNLSYSRRMSTGRSLCHRNISFFSRLLSPLAMLIRSHNFYELSDTLGRRPCMSILCAVATSFYEKSQTLNPSPMSPRSTILR